MTPIQMYISGLAAEQLNAITSVEDHFKCTGTTSCNYCPLSDVCRYLLEEGRVRFPEEENEYNKFKKAFEVLFLPHLKVLQSIPMREVQKTYPEWFI